MTSTVKIVKPSDIIEKPNGNGGWEFLFYGNRQWYACTLKGIDSISKGGALNFFVNYLNSIPIMV